MSQLMRLRYLSHRRPAKAQASLRIRTASPQPSLFAHMQYESRWRVRPKSIRLWSSPTGWLRMRVWRMSLRRAKSTIISWHGSNVFQANTTIRLRWEILLLRKWGRYFHDSCLTSSNFIHDEIAFKAETWLQMSHDMTKCVFESFRPGQTQTGLHSHRS